MVRVGLLESIAAALLSAVLLPGAPSAAGAHLVLSALPVRQAVQEGAPSTIEEARERVRAAREGAEADPQSLPAALNQLAEMALKRPGQDAAEAESAAREAVELQSASPTSGLAHSRYLLARALDRQGKVREARGHYEEAVRLWIETIGPSNPRVADALQGLATTLMETGHLEYARQFFGQALEIRANAFGSMHPLVADTLFGQASLLARTEQYGEALRLFQQALAIRQTSLGVNHPLVADTLLEIGRILVAQGENQRALEPFQQALAIRRLFGSSDPLKVAEAEYELGSLLIDLLRRDEARPLLEHAVEVRRRLLPPGDPLLAAALSALGRCYRNDDRSEAALPLFQEASEIMAAVYADTLSRLAAVKQNQADFGAAGKLQQQALEIRRTAFGEDHPMVAVSLTSLGNLQQAMGQLDQAQELFERSLSIVEKFYGPSH